LDIHEHGGSAYPELLGSGLSSVPAGAAEAQPMGAHAFVASKTA
jgi:hypothetical protein